MDLLRHAPLLSTVSVRHSPCRFSSLQYLSVAALDWPRRKVVTTTAMLVSFILRKGKVRMRSGCVM
jgi:hypothetical protein